jgi:hypothetical protein
MKGLMLEDMEALFSMDNNQHVPENINCFCFPDLKSTYIGFRVLSDGLRIGPHKRKEKSVGTLRYIQIDTYIYSYTNIYTYVYIPTYT